MPNRSIINRAAIRSCLPTACALGLLTLISTPAQAATVLTDGNSSTILDFANPAIQSPWVVEGQNQLNQSGFYYRIGAAGPEASVASIGPAIVSTYNGTRGVIATYNGGTFTLSVDYLLTGGNPGDGHSALSETIEIINTSGQTLDFHFFSYSDFDLAGSPMGDSVTLNTIGGNYYVTDQAQPGATIAQTVNTPGANLGEAALAGVTLTKLTDGDADILSNVNAAGPGDVTWALQWNLSIAAGQSVQIVKGTIIQLQVIPEPSSVAVFGLGLAGLALKRFRKR
jgi:hypothetical protein